MRETDRLLSNLQENLYKLLEEPSTLIAKDMLNVCLDLAAQVKTSVAEANVFYSWEQVSEPNHLQYVDNTGDIRGFIFPETGVHHHPYRMWIFNNETEAPYKDLGRGTLEHCKSTIEDYVSSGGEVTGGVFIPLHKERPVTNAEMKAKLIGEYFIEREYATEDEDTSEGVGVGIEKIDIPWTTMKDIYQDMCLAAAESVGRFVVKQAPRGYGNTAHKKALPMKAFKEENDPLFVPGDSVDKIRPNVWINPLTNEVFPLSTFPLFHWNGRRSLGYD